MNVVYHSFICCWYFVYVLELLLHCEYVVGRLCRMLVKVSMWCQGKCLLSCRDEYRFLTVSLVRIAVLVCP